MEDDKKTREDLLAEITHLRSEIADLKKNDRPPSNQTFSHTDILDTVFQASPVGIGIVNDQIMGWANGRMQFLTGYSLEELYGQPGRMIYPSEEEFLRVHREVFDQIRDKEVGSVETTWQQKNGQSIDILLNFSMINREDPSEGLIFAAIDITEFKTVQKERKRLLSILEKTPDLIATSDSQGKILYINQPGRRSLGLPEDCDVSNYEIPSFYPKDEYARILTECLRETRETGMCIHETIMLRQNGSHFPVSQIIMAHKSAEGVIDYYTTIVRDISEALAARKALQESEKKFRSIVQSSPMGILMYRLEDDGRLIFEGANKASNDLLGLDCSIFIGKTIEEAFPPLQETEIPERYRKAARDGIPWKTDQIDYEDNHIKGAFEVYAFQTSPGRMVALFSEITERIQSQIALKASEEKYRTLFETMAQGVVYQDRNGSIISVNPSALEILGLNEDLMMGRTSDDPKWQSLHEDGEPFPGHEHPSMVALKTGKVTREIMGVYNPLDAHYRWIDISSTPQFRQNEKTPYQVVSTFSDITDRKKAEEDKKQIELQLQHQQKLESIGTLASGVAHEINNPINGILNYAQLISNRIEPDNKLKNYAERIVKESERIAEIVRCLLTFSRQDKQAHSPASLKDIIHNSMTLMGAVLRKDQIDISLDLDEEVPRIKCRSQQIQQVIMNLLTNARDALNDKYSTYHQNKKLLISLKRLQSNEGLFVRTTIKDNGSGISEEHINRIFDPFFTTKPRSLGTGLGLSVSYGIVHEHHGRLRAESTPGESTQIHLDLPVDNGWSIDKNTRREN